MVSQSYKPWSHLTAFCNTWTSKFHSTNALRGFEDFYDPVREDVLQTGRAWTVADLRRKVNETVLHLSNVMRQICHMIYDFFKGFQ